MARRRGKFELAHRGTLFLDEIADMSLVTQAKVLRVLQEMRFERVGGEESISVDVRSSPRRTGAPRALIGAGRFREDLFFRLNVIPITSPRSASAWRTCRALVAYFMEKLKPPVPPPSRWPRTR